MVISLSRSSKASFQSLSNPTRTPERLLLLPVGAEGLACGKCSMVLTAGDPSQVTLSRSHQAGGVFPSGPRPVHPDSQGGGLGHSPRCGAPGGGGLRSPTCSWEAEAGAGWSLCRVTQPTEDRAPASESSFGFRPSTGCGWGPGSLRQRGAHWRAAGTPLSPDRGGRRAGRWLLSLSSEPSPTAPRRPWRPGVSPRSSPQVPSSRSSACTAEALRVSHREALVVSGGSGLGFKPEFHHSFQLGQGWGRGRGT